MDWDDAYANGAYIDGAEDYPRRWKDAAGQFRKSARKELDLPYAEGARTRYDLFLPEGPAKGLFIFIHGGYWLAFDKSSWSHLAAGAVESGWAAALPSYDLCPDVSITTITQEIARFIETAAGRIDGPIIIAGHSAGGHLAARMICEGVLPEAVSARIARVVAISGLFDLRPLRHTKMNEAFKLSESDAEAESPLLCAPNPGAEILAWVGAEERPEFIRQSRDFFAAWFAKGARVNLRVQADRHHFNVIDDLADPKSEMMRYALTGKLAD